MEKATQTLLEVSTNPTISVLKSMLERTKKRDKKQKDNTDSYHVNDEDHGFVRGAKYFGGGDQ